MPIAAAAAAGGGRGASAAAPGEAASVGGAAPAVEEAAASGVFGAAGAGRGRGRGLGGWTLSAPRSGSPTGALGHSPSAPGLSSVRFFSTEGGAGAAGTSADGSTSAASEVPQRSKVGGRYSAVQCCAIRYSALLYAQPMAGKDSTVQCNAVFDGAAKLQC